MNNTLDRRQFLAGVGAAAVVAPGCAALGRGSGGRKPNFIVIFTDDQGYQDVGCYGAPLIKTPNLDKMAAEGVKFTDFYVAAPVCSASRAALMTGCYPARVDITGVVFPPHPKGLNPDEITIAEVLRGQGYATTCIGKWHLGHYEEFLPTNHGFDSYFGIPYSNDMVIERNGTIGPPLMRDTEIIEHPVDQTTITRRYTEEAVKFMTENKDRPFFLYLPHTMPHTPLHVSDKFKGKSAGGLYGDVIEEIDWSTGVVLDKVRELGLADNTLVIFTSDNGPWLQKRSHGGSALPLRDGKFTVYEGGMRVPCIMWWPGSIPARTTCSELATTLDFLPTLARLAGTTEPRDRIIDGKNIWPLMSGQPGAGTPHDVFYFRDRALRQGMWKFHPDRVHTKRVAGADGKVAEERVLVPPELYDLEHDVAERMNLADQHPELVKRFSRMLREHNEEIQRTRRRVMWLSPEDLKNRPLGAASPIPEQWRHLLEAERRRSK